MKVNGTHYRTVWMQNSDVMLINQIKLPFAFEIYRSQTYSKTCTVISSMLVRGAGAIGATAGYAMAQAVMELHAQGIGAVESAKNEIESTRPTAQNLFYATNRVFATYLATGSVAATVDEAQAIADEDAMACKQIGQFGKSLIKDGFRIETHCNAGWLAFVDYGSALSPVYAARDDGKSVFVYADETRPRNQGAKLTAWELNQEDIPHSIIPDNAGAYLMSLGKVDMMIVGADRIAANGDVVNKIGTLEKAICAKEFGIPFYVAAPSSTFDLSCEDGRAVIIEERSPDEVLFADGLTKDGADMRIRVSSEHSQAVNYGFDVTPAQYITGIITVKGIINADRESISRTISRG